MGTDNQILQSRLVPAQQLKTIGRRALVFVFRFQSFFGLIIVFLLAIYLSPIRDDENIFLSQRNLSNVARDVSETGILATGQLLVILSAGIDLSVGSVVALTATTSGAAADALANGDTALDRASIELSHLSAEEAIILVLGLGLLIGWWNGWTSERFRIPAFVTTLAMLSIARGIAHIWSDNIAVPISYKAGGADPAFEILA